MSANNPFNELPNLPPVVDLETPRVLKAAIAANRELAQLKGYCALLPNETILLNSIILQEARASSEIENIITTHDDLYRAMVIDYQSIEPATKEVLNYRSATWTGYELLKKTGSITTNMIVTIQKELEGNDAGIRTLPGTALVNDATGETIYIPPDDPVAIQQLLTNLETYLNTDIHPVDPLIRMAVAHYQFESIHPFYDGNGRTGRIVNVLYLVKEELLDSPILYLSRNIIRDKRTYYRLLQGIRENGEWEEWVVYMLELIAGTADETLGMIRQIVKLMDETIEEARKNLPKASYSKELIETIITQPYTKIEHLVQQGIAERRTASKYLQQLEEIGILIATKEWKQKIYINHRLVDLLKRRA